MGKIEYDISDNRSVILDLCVKEDGFEFASTVTNALMEAESELREIAGCCLLGLDHLHKHNLSHSVCIWNEAQLVGHDIESFASFKEGSCAIECIL